MVSLLNCNSYYITQRTETFVSIMRCQKRWSNCDNQLNLINFHRVPIIPRQNKGQKMNKNVKFWHSLKVKPGFLILLINLKTGATQWRAGVGRQRGTKVREAGERGTGNGRLWPPVPPPPTKMCASQEFLGALWRMQFSRLRASPWLCKHSTNSSRFSPAWLKWKVLCRIGWSNSYNRNKVKCVPLFILCYKFTQKFYWCLKTTTSRFARGPFFIFQFVSTSSYSSHPPWPFHNGYLHFLWLYQS